MSYIIYYILLGIFVGFATWFWKSFKYNDFINEGYILIYLFGCIFIWPIVLIETLIDIIYHIYKYYCSTKN